MIEHIIFDLGNVLIDIHPEKTLDELAGTHRKIPNGTKDFSIAHPFKFYGWNALAHWILPWIC